MIFKSMAGPANQKVTFIELFFDLVFVFAVTQVVSLMHDEISWATVGQAVLVFWMVWWAWTQFTWALNAADTTHNAVALGTLLATGVAFFMAVSLPDAYHGRELWFAIPYVIVRVVGLIIYGMVASIDPLQRAAVRNFAAFSAGGLILVVLGATFGGAEQYWLWGAAILLDLVASAVGSKSENWNLHTEHFVERHGLIVIIALGESLIVTASGLAGVDWTFELVLAASLAVVVTFGFWWSYFPVALPRLEHALARVSGAGHSQMARDVFSVIHFPMLLGVIALAVAAEEVIAHPENTLALEARLMLSASLLLFVGGMAVATFRASGQILLPRLIVILLAALAVAVLEVSPLVSLALATTGVGVALVGESLVKNDKPTGLDHLEFGDQS